MKYRDDVPSFQRKEVNWKILLKLSYHQAQFMLVYFTLPHKCLYCDGEPVHFAEQAEHAALGKQANLSFIQLLCFQVISDISKWLAESSQIHKLSHSK